MNCGRPRHRTDRRAVRRAAPPRPARAVRHRADLRSRQPVVPDRGRRRSKNLGGDDGGALGQQFARGPVARPRSLRLLPAASTRGPSSRPRPRASRAEAIDFVGWASIGAQELVKGGVSGRRATRSRVEVRLFDVTERRDVAEVGRRMSGPRADLPRMAHRFADQLLEVLTGERGPFDSQIALVSTRGGRLKEIYLCTFDMDDAGAAHRASARSSLSPRWRPDRARHPVHVLPRAPAAALPARRWRARAVTQLVAGPRASCLGGAWSPDGSRVAVTREDGGNSDIVLLDRCGRREPPAHRSLGRSTCRRPGRPTAGASRSAPAARARRRST